MWVREAEPRRRRTLPGVTPRLRKGLSGAAGPFSHSNRNTNEEGGLSDIASPSCVSSDLRRRAPAGWLGPFSCSRASLTLNSMLLAFIP